MNKVYYHKNVRVLAFKMNARTLKSKSMSVLNREWVDLLPQTNFSVLALKINELCLLKKYTSVVEVKMEAEVKIEVRS